MKRTLRTPAYLQVARDIAGKIATGDLREGERFSGRSLMSSQYNVSSETIRRALGLLAEMGVIEIKPKVGALVVSRQRAALYLKQYGRSMSMRDLKSKLVKAVAQRKALDSQIDDMITKLTDMAERFRYSDVMQTYEFTIPDQARISGMTIEETAFRKHTGATIAAVRREGEVILSPKSDVRLQSDDTLIVVCDIIDLSEVSAFVNEAAEKPPQ
jgi:DNA-binding GntR family transcriptional regulator